MKYMLTWRIPPATYRAAVDAFLATGAPMPDGLTALGRWHAPGSQHGWLLCETDDPVSLAEHVAQWATMLECEVTPVIDDPSAGKAAARVFTS